MKQTRNYIRTLLIMALLLGGVANEAWAVDVVYKVIDNEGRLAITSQKVTGCTAGTTVLSVPDSIASALLDKSEYIYYKNATQTGSDKYGTFWEVKDEDKIIDNKLPSGVTTIYVRYEKYDLNNVEMKNRMKALGLLTNGFYNIKERDRYMYKSYWNEQVNTYFGTYAEIKKRNGVSEVSSIDDALGWEFDFSDPYAILIKSRYKEDDLYLTVGGTFSDVRVWKLSEAKNQFFWSFILVKGIEGKYNGNPYLRLLVANDNYLKNRGGQTGKALANYSTDANGYIKTRYITASNPIYYDLNIIPVGTVVPTFKLVTHFGKQVLSVTLPPQPVKSAIVLPDALKRKFCSYPAFYCRYDENHTVDKGTSDENEKNYKDYKSNYCEVSNYPLMDVDGSEVTILVEYNVDSEPGANFFDGTYSLLVNNTVMHNPGDRITAGSGSTDNEMAFQLNGDPYTVQISNQDPGKCIGIAAGSTTSGQSAGFVSKTGLEKDKVYAGTINSGDIEVWEMIDVRNYLSEEFALRQFNTYDDPKYLGSTSPLQYQTTTSRIKLVKMVLSKEYTYHIINRNDVEAIKCTVKQQPGITLNYQNLPAAIRSHYIENEVLTFRIGAKDGEFITRTPTPEDGKKVDIYVRYTLSKLSEKAVKLNSTQAYNMQVNDDEHEYVYVSDPDPYAISLNASGDDKGSAPYFWLLEGGDPYAVEVKNLQSDNYLNFSDATNPAKLDLQSSSATTKFILMSETGGNTIQLMAATGDKYDAADDYYYIGYNSSVTVIDKATKEANSEKANLILSSNLPDVTYHIIDKQGKDILQFTTNRQELAVPEEIRSPLVEKWQFWLPAAFKEEDGVYTLIDGEDKYNGNTSSNRLTYRAQAITDHIYVTYRETGAVASGYLSTANPDPTELSRTETEGKTTINMGRNYNDSGWANMFLLKYWNGEKFFQEDAKDGFEKTKTQAVYPYTCGDGAMYVYGEVDWEDQLSKGASTRTRWPWFLVSYNEDPYHVKVTSYQQTHAATSVDGATTTNTRYYNYLRTYYNTTAIKAADGTDAGGRIITVSVTDDPLVTNYNAVTNPHGDPSATPTEYMILGTMNNFKLVTVQEIAEGSTNTVEALGRRQTVETFDQYWKTWETILKKGTVTFETNPDIQSRADIKNDLYTYDAWAYARPTVTTGTETAGGDKRYKYEKHYYQTVSMGETFDLVPVSFDPILVLLDKHGWEIMRKPIPVTKDAAAEITEKLKAIQAYDSPMVKTYHWFTNASKLTGYHKYAPSNPEIIVYKKDGTKWVDSGSRYVHTSTSLADLPYDHLTPEQGYGDDLTSSAAKDANKTDLYVTYDVHEEYDNTYKAALVADDVVAQEYLLYTGGNESAETVMTKNGYAKASDETTLEKYYEANLYNNIELGNRTYRVSETDYDVSKMNELLWYVKPNFDIDHEMGYMGDPIHYTLADNGFDPYNVQIQSKKYNTYLTTNAIGTTFDANGTLISTYNGTAALSLEPMTDDENGAYTAVGFDQTRMRITNATFMVVSDENGNMRLMPRFDQAHVMENLLTLKTPLATAPAKDRNFKQTVDFMRPVEFQYYIIDNEGYESLRYKGRLGEHEPEIPEHFKSPLAKDFRYYGSAYRSEEGLYTVNEEDENEITSTFGAADLLSDYTDVYVRYSYDEEKDKTMRILQGNWLTMKLHDQDVKYESGIVSGTKPATSPTDNLINAYEWHWKFLRSPSKKPDPYGVQLLNRKHKDMQMSVTDFDDSEAFKADSSNAYQRFALLSHTAPDTYALAVGGVKSNTDYYFMSGRPLPTLPAVIEKETTFSSISKEYSSTNSEIKLTNDVNHKYTYKVIRNDKKIAVTAGETMAQAESSHYVVSLPTAAQSPLLNASDYLYYAEIKGASEAEPYEVNEATEIPTLLGLYGQYAENIYVRYKKYDENKSPYLVANTRNNTASLDIDEGSERSHPVDLSGNTAYNIIWGRDYMMYKNSSALGGAKSQPLTVADNYVWKFAGDDPYDIKLKNGDNSSYVKGTGFDTEANATSWMLLKKENYDYGVLAVSDGKSATAETPELSLLRNYDGSTATTNPTRFLVFALTTNLTYRLYFHETSKRYSDRYWDYYVGPIGVGKKLTVPVDLGRPLCDYTFYKHNTSTQITELPEENFGTSVFVDVKYTPNQDYFLSNAEAIDGAAGRSVVKWRTLDTDDAAAYRADYTYTRGTLAASPVGGTHYTNDYLWVPEGDPYGFNLHNRYATVNGNGWQEVMTTAQAPADGTSLTLSATKEYATYEMLYADEENPSSLYFKLHPRMAANGVYVYNDAGNMTLSSTKSTNWTLALTKEQLKPYFDRYGYVGALNTAAYNTEATDKTGITKYLREAYDDKVTPTEAQLKEAQALCYNDDKIIKLYRTVGRPDYYSIHDASSSPRYISGYTHYVEQLAGLNLHYHELATEQVPATYGGLPAGSYEETAATRGDIPLEPALEDPASIFYFNPITSSLVTISTQGLYVNTEGESTKMTTTPENLTYMDIGGGIVMLRSGNDITTGYLAPDPIRTMTIARGSDNELSDNAKWCLQPVDEDLPLRVKTRQGRTKAGDTQYDFATFYAPFDVFLPDGAKAFVCKQWDDRSLHLSSIGRYNTKANQCPELYENSDRFIPAGTPVIIRTTGGAGHVDLEIAQPGGELGKARYPSTVTAAAIAKENIFEGMYLERNLGVGPRVFTFGQPYTNKFTLDNSTGEVTVTGDETLAGVDADVVGFYTNANPYRELHPIEANWTRNNWYVYHNKVYCRPEPAAGARRRAIGHFVPVVFDDEPEEPISEDLNGQMLRSGCVYDLQGRCVASGEAVRNGSWRNMVAPGVYIVNGKKVKL